MTTQRDRLAAALHEAAIGCTVKDGMCFTLHRYEADALIVRGVRVVDEGSVVIDRRTWELMDSLVKTVNKSFTKHMDGEIGR